MHKHKSSGHYKVDGHHSSHGSVRHPDGDPDRGPPMLEGAHHFDKGYMSDEKEFSPLAGSNHDTHDHQRGNHYMKLQNDAVHRDDAKIRKGKFSKIA